jgi:hypothetical protein
MRLVYARWLFTICILIISPTLLIFIKQPIVTASPSPSSLQISILPTPPSELNPQGGGTPKATFDQAAAFAWQEFIALNWPAGPQLGNPGQRDTPSTTCHFGDPGCTGPLTWETFRGKVEIFPGNANPFKYQPPPGYPGPKGDSSYGYDALPVYNYSTTISACDQSQSGDSTPWVNLDETDQITLDNMYAGVVDPGSSPGNSSPQLIRFLAKANRSQYVYVAGNSSSSDPSDQWWVSIPQNIVAATKSYLATNQASPPPNSSQYVSLPDGTIEVKAAWRPLNPSELASGRFHSQTVRFYEQGPNSSKCYRDAVWGLVALHIIQKTPSAPYFIYATFEQADNVLTSQGDPVEDANGNIIVKPPPKTATIPQVCLVDPQPPVTQPQSPEITSSLGSVIETDDPSTCKRITTQTYCGAPGNQLYLRNSMGSPPNSEPSAGNICIDKRENPIPDYAVETNAQAHTAIAAYLKQSGVASAPWLYYKLVNVQYFPYDKIIPNPPMPNGSLYTSKPPYSAQNPPASSFYQANIVVETNRSLQLFSGGLSPNISTDWNQDGSPHKNSYYGGHFYNMGGCMGCHGSQGQNPAGMAGDFSVILARGTVSQPESPALETSKGLTFAKRNRSLSK